MEIPLLAIGVPTGLEALAFLAFPLALILWLGNSGVAVFQTFKQRLGVSALVHIALPLLIVAVAYTSEGHKLSLAVAVGLPFLQLAQLVYLLRLKIRRAGAAEAVPEPTSAAAKNPLPQNPPQPR